MSFLYENVLFFMLIPSFILLFIIIKKGDKFAQYFNKETLDKLSVSNRYFSVKARSITLLIALIFMIIALARPVTNEKNVTSKQKISSVVIAIDISKSMLANDILPSRLTFAKEKTINLIDEYKDFAIAVIVFAKDAFILSPLTQDLNSLKYLVNNLDYTLDFNNGTNIYATLEASNKLLKDYENKNLILLTDGGDKKDFQDEIELALENKIKVYTIATATAKPTPIKLKDNTFLTNKNNQVVTVKLNENIKKLALQSDGGYINFTLNNSDILQIKNEINSSFANKQFKSKNHKTYTELFYYPLAFSIFLLLIAFSSLPNLKNFNKKTTSFFILITFFVISPYNLKASIFDFKYIEESNKAYEEKNYDKAYDELLKINDSKEKEYNLANILYKQNKYKEAIKRYESIKSDDRILEFNRLHNLGNAYAKDKQYKKAIKSYKEALKIKEDKATRQNLEKVKKLLENKNKPNKDNNNSNENKKNNKQKENKKQTPKQNNQKDKQKQEDKKENQNSKKSKDTKNKNQENKQQENINEKKYISKKEEEKWLNQLEKKKPKVFLQKVKSKNNQESQTAW